jgi:uncharacterized protein with FMN-binding domain
MRKGDTMKARGISIVSVVLACVLVAGVAIVGSNTVASANESADRSTVSGSYNNGTFGGAAEGYMGPLSVEVVVANGQITAVNVVNSVDTEAFLGNAVNGVIPAIIAANTINGVDVSTGATYSSRGIIEAVANALEQAGAQVTSPMAQAAQAPQAPQVRAIQTAEGDIYRGLGSNAIGRLGPGRDDTGTPIYSFNITMVTALFDANGRILDVLTDIYEVATPNYRSAGMPKLSGWPGAGGYNVFDTEADAIIGLSENTEDLFLAEVESWVTKRERGSSYGMNPRNDWYQQMDWFEDWMVGKTTAELRSWFDRYTSPRNGRPINPASTHEADVAALAAMSADEISMLADVITGATMSLSDPHGLMLEAIENAYENRELVLRAGGNSASSANTTNNTTRSPFWMRLFGNE